MEKKEFIVGATYQIDWDAQYDDFHGTGILRRIYEEPLGLLSFDLRDGTKLNVYPKDAKIVLVSIPEELVRVVNVQIRESQIKDLEAFLLTINGKIV